MPSSRAALHARIEARFAAMLAAGFVAEVRLLHSRNDLHAGLTALRSDNPGLKVFGRENFHGTLHRVLREHPYKQFRGAGFR